MNISAIQNFKTNIHQQKNNVGASLCHHFKYTCSPLNQDIVSFGTKYFDPEERKETFKKSKHHTANYERIKKQTRERESAQKAMEQRAYEIILSKEKFDTEVIKKQILKEEISKQELIYIVNQLRNDSEALSKIFITNTGCEPLLKQTDSIMNKICYLLNREEQFLAIALNKDHTGKNFFDKATTEQIRIFNNAVKRFPNVLSKIYTTKDSAGRLPAHKITAKALESMNFVLAEQPKILRQIYYTKDCNGNTPAHNRLEYGQKIIEKALAPYPEALHKIRTTKNNYNELYDHLLNKVKSYNGPYLNTWEFLLNNY